MTGMEVGLRSLADSYQALLCDLWGVVHNGVSAFDEAAEALSRFRQGGGRVLLISNAPRPSMTVAAQLATIGVAREAWDAILTSGDLTRDGLRRGRYGRIHHLGPARDKPLMEGLPPTVSERDAESVLCTGLLDDARERPEDYAPLLRRLHARRLPMLCANPDKIVQRGESLIPCAGALADLYQAMGGAVVFFGKPHSGIYDRAMEILLRLGVSDKRRILAIGDGLQTDMLGASAYGLDRLFIGGGVAAASLPDLPTEEALRRIFGASHMTPPDFFMARLFWQPPPPRPPRRPRPPTRPR